MSHIASSSCGVRLPPLPLSRKPSCYRTPRAPMNSPPIRRREMSNRAITTERAFEDTITQHLCEHGGYELGQNERWSRELAFDRYTLLEFIQATQPEAWEKLSAIHGSDVERRFLLR